MLAPVFMTISLAINVLVLVQLGRTAGPGGILAVGPNEFDGLVRLELIDFMTMTINIYNLQNYNILCSTCILYVDRGSRKALDQPCTNKKVGNYFKRTWIFHGFYIYSCGCHWGMKRK